MASEPETRAAAPPNPPNPPTQRPAGGRRPGLGRVLRALAARGDDARPPGVPRLKYHFPRQWLIAMGGDLLFDRPRSFKEDCALAVRSLPRRPVVAGLEHVPAAGSFILVANHYQRRDLWIGWVGGLLCDAVWGARPEIVCHWVAEDRAVLDGAGLAWTRPIFARVAHVWDLVLVTPAEARDADADGSRRRALRDCLRRLRRPDGRSVCLAIMPEGITGGTRGLIPAMPGSGRSLLAMAATGAALVPAGVWEDETGALHARFGPAWRPAPPADIPRQDLDAWVGDDAMRRIAALLPRSFRGIYRDHTPTGA